MSDGGRRADVLDRARRGSSPEAASAGLPRPIDLDGTPLGPRAGWPRSLAAVFDMMMASGQAMCLAWGPELTFLHNAAYAPCLGARHPGAQGRPFREVWPDVWNEIAPLVDRALAGQTVTFDALPLTMARNGTPEETWWRFSYSPLRDDGGAVAGVLNVASEVTGQVVADRRQALLASLTEATLAGADAPAIMAHAVDLLGRHLRASRVGYGQVLDDDHTVRLEVCYADGVAALRGDFPLDGFGPDSIARQRRGETEACNDVRADPAQVQATWDAIDVRAFASAPLVRGGRLAASLYVNHREPHRWTPDEVALIEEVAARTWAAVERAQAEARLREQAGELARAREALAASDAKFQAIANSIDPMIWSTRPDGFHDYYNDRWYAFTGVPPGSTDGEAWAGLFHPDDQPRAWAAWRESLATGRPYEIEYRLRHRSGAWRWVLGRAQCARDEGGRIARWFGTCTDIEDLVAARDVLARSREELEEAVALRTAERNRVWQMSRDLFAVMGFDGRLKAINPAWTATLGLDEATLLARPFAEQVHPDDHAAAAAVIERLRRGEAVPRFEDRLRHADGSWRWIAWGLVPEGDAEGDVFYAVGRDVTAEKEAAARIDEAEAALRQAQKMEAVGQLTGGLAHDFNNLLAGIGGSLELMQARLAQGRLDAIDRYMTAAQGAVKRAAALTHRLLAFSRRQTLDPRPADPNRLVADLEELVRRTVGPGIEVEVVGTGGAWTVLVDPNQLENALLNLCINARDAMPEGGRLTIETANAWLDDRAAQARDLLPGQYVSICVTDTGTGMTPEVQAKAFDPFFTTKPLGEGTGLGLSMVYGFARQSGGSARIYSEPGQGTTMCLYLPRHDGVADPGPEAAEAAGGAGGRGGKVVLVIDDEPTIRMLAAEVLEEAGHVALEAPDGPAGLRMLEAAPRVDLLITDAGLPGGLNGRQVADAAREMRPDLRVLFITGYAANAVVGHGHLPQGMAVVTKPFAMDALARKIHDLLEAQAEPPAPEGRPPHRARTS